MKKSLFILIVIGIIHSCSYTKRVNDGQFAYDSKQYAVAVELLEKEYHSKNSSEYKANKAFLLAKSFGFMNDYINSRIWYQNAVDHNYGDSAMLGLAMSHKMNKSYDKAIDVYREIERKYGKQADITRELNICRQAMHWLQPNEKYEIDIKNYRHNSAYADYAPVLYEDDHLVFSSDRIISTGSENYMWTGNRFSDIYIADKKSGEVELFGANVNTSNNEATITFNKDFTEIFFTRCFSDELNEDDDFCKIMYSKFVDNSWTPARILRFQDELTNYGHPALIENDSVLVFSSKLKEGFGGHDLYYAVRLDDGWSEAAPMPSSINTQGNEKFPSSDGDTLYFSSDYLPGLGGLDIFKTYLLANGRWSPPKNLKAPFNSSTDDFSLIIDRSNPSKNIYLKGYFSSSRNYETQDDIFEFVMRSKIETKEKDVVEKAPAKNEVKIYLACKVVHNIYADNGNPSSKLIGKESLSNASISLVLDSITQMFETDKDGRFITQLNKNSNYLIGAKKNGYFKGQKNVSTFDLFTTHDTVVTINVEISLDKLIIDKEIVLENIYYDFDKWNIRENAKPSLDILLKILKNNPKLKVRLGSHTDCIGNDAYNKNLSQKRAESAVAYMIENGINAKMIEPQGFGETVPVAKCKCEDCSDSQHQSNRRTTFKILKTN